MDIKLEDVQAFLSTDEGKALIAPMIEEAKLPVVNKYKEFQQEKDKVKAKLAEYEALGDAKTIAQMLETAKTAQDTKTDVVDQGLLDALRNEVKAKEAALNTFKNGFLNSQLDNTLSDAIAKHKGVPELLKAPLSNRLKAEFNDSGNVVISVLNESGTAIQYHSDERPYTVEDLVLEYKNNQIYGRAFEGTGANGTGTRESPARSGGVITDPKAPGYNRTKHMEYLAKKAK